MEPRPASVRRPAPKLRKSDPFRWSARSRMNTPFRDGHGHVLARAPFFFFFFLLEIFCPNESRRPSPPRISPLPTGEIAGVPPGFGAWVPLAGSTTTTSGGQHIDQETPFRRHAPNWFGLPSVRGGVPSVVAGYQESNGARGRAPLRLRTGWAGWRVMRRWAVLKRKRKKHKRASGRLRALVSIAERLIATVSRQKKPEPNDKTPTVGGVWGI